MYTGRRPETVFSKFARRLSPREIQQKTKQVTVMLARPPQPPPGAPAFAADKRLVCVFFPYNYCVVVLAAVFVCRILRFGATAEQKKEKKGFILLHRCSLNVVFFDALSPMEYVLHSHIVNIIFKSSPLAHAFNGLLLFRSTMVVSIAFYQSDYARDHAEGVMVILFCYFITKNYIK